MCVCVCVYIYIIYIYVWILTNIGAHGSLSFKVIDTYEVATISRLLKIISLFWRI